MKKLLTTVIALCLALSSLKAQNVVVWTNSGAPSEVMNVPLDLTNAVQVSGGATHAVALCDDGRVVSWGKTNAGQLNVPTDFSAGVVQVCASSNFSAALLDNGTVRYWGTIPFFDPLQQARLAGITNAVQISTGLTNLYVLMDDGSITCFPYEYYRGPATTYSGVSNAVYLVTSGATSWAALCADGSISNGSSGSMVSSNAINIIGLTVQGNIGIAVRGDAKVNYWTETSGGAGTTPPDQTNVVAVAVGCPNGVISLDQYGNVKKVIGTLTVPTNLPALKAIGAGNKFGVGILQ